MTRNSTGRKLVAIAEPPSATRDLAAGNWNGDCIRKPLEQFPAPRSNQTEPIEPEIVDTKPLRLPWWRRALSRVAASLLLIVVGVVLCLMGAVLTITFVGAPLGLPLIFIGLFFILMALFVLFAKGIRRF